MSKIHNTAIIGNNCVIGNNVIVGAGSVVLKDISDNTIYIQKRK